MERRGADYRKRGTRLRDPDILATRLADVRFAWLWLALRLPLGWWWLDSGWDRLQRPRSTLAAGAGGAWAGMLAWGPRWLLGGQDETRLPRLLAVGQTLAGIALLLGLLTGLAAFGGGVLPLGLANVGPAPATPLLFVAVVWLVLA